MECKYCGGNVKEEFKIFSNGTKHIKLSCQNCGRGLGFKPQGNDFELWFGKYKGQMVSEVYNKDKEYLLWCIDNLDYKISTKIKTILNKLN